MLFLAKSDVKLKALQASQSKTNPKIISLGRQIRVILRLFPFKACLPARFLLTELNIIIASRRIEVNQLASNLT
jgi:hypothetical protein